MSGTPLLQDELQFKDQATPDTYFANRLISQMQRELSQKKRHMVLVASKWLVAYDYVKMLEEEYLLAEDPISSHGQFLRGSVSVVKGLGTLLLAQLRNEDVEKLESLGLAYRDLVGCVEELGDLDRQLSSGLTPEMIEEMNQRLFSRNELPRTQTASS